MGFRDFGKTQLGKYSVNFTWEGAVKRPLYSLVNALQLQFISLQFKKGTVEYYLKIFPFMKDKPFTYDAMGRVHLETTYSDSA